MVPESQVMASASGLLCLVFSMHVVLSLLYSMHGLPGRSGYDRWHFMQAHQSPAIGKLITEDASSKGNQEGFHDLQRKVSNSILVVIIHKSLLRKTQSQSRGKSQ